MKIVKLTRQQLYERVWQEPMSRLAATFGLSDVGLAKICRKHNVPRPPRGYWAKKEFGQSPAQTPLPKPENNDAIEFYQTERGEQQADPLPVAIEERIAAEKETAAPLKVSDNLRGAHNLVSLANQELAQIKPDDNGIVRPPKDAVLQVCVSRNGIRRAMLIMDALIKAIEQRGHEVTSGPTIKMLGASFSFGIIEELAVRQEQPAEHDLEGGYSFGHSRYLRSHVPSGRFVLTINEGGQYWAKGSRHRWKDTDKHPLEDRLDGVIPALLELAGRFQQHLEEQRKREEERKAEERRQQQAAIQRAKKREEYSREKARFELLLEQLKGWQHSKDLRDFLNSAKQSHLAKPGRTELTPEFAEWFAWASLQADRMDPLMDSPPSILDEDPQQFEDPRPSYERSWQYRQ
ncbi:MAG: hypothetical protein K8R36_19230 [Planctomycetales bacterium]|nr:hypothetical protein [Planctomycetales bacterium]